MDKLKKVNILFLEDNEEFAKNTTELLSIYFKKVYHVNSIKSAYEIIDDYKIDFIITDIKLQDGNGLEFIKQLRDNDYSTPIIILSSYKNEKLLLQAIPLHVEAYELKPLSYEKFENLIETISKVLKPKNIITINNELRYNTKSKEILYRYQKIQLTKKEINFVEYLVKKSPGIVSPDMIQVNVWENKIMSNSAIKNLILRLRKKVPTQFIVNVGGVGYKLAS